MGQFIFGEGIESQLSFIHEELSNDILSAVFLEIFAMD